jgi:hypothetical protein
MTTSSLALALALLGAAQESKKKDFELVDPARVDQAIRKGVEFLRSASSPSAHEGIEDSHELILLALLHAGASPGDARFDELLKLILGAPLVRTYKVALQAIVLEELDRVRYQKRIWECAQFLVDNQCGNGQWSYGEPTRLGEYPAGTPTGARPTPSPGSSVKVFGAASERIKPKVLVRVPVRKQRDAEGDGDNSNSQYAALGLRACHDAGILLPRETVERALKWWRLSQEDGAKAEEQDDDDAAKKKPAPPVPTGPGAPAKPFGWEYGREGKGTGSMTAGAVGALVIGNALLGRNWKSDRDVAEGLAWLAKHFTVTQNPGSDEWHYYYLYALERVGMLCDIERIGTHPWYSTGARFLLDAQKPDGSWKGADGESQATWDTCFAILFLKRATRRVDVATVGGGGYKDK